MKKLFLLVLVIVMLIGSNAAADDQDPCGMWVFYWDARSLPMSFDIQAYSLFLLEDGSAYMQHAQVKNGKNKITPDLISGVWIGDASELTIRVSDNIYKAWIDSSGRLFLKMTDSMAYVFTKVPLYNYEEGILE